MQAVKTLEKPALRPLFVAEARLLMPLVHEHVVRLAGLTVMDDEPWRLVLEFCEHDSLHAVVCFAGLLGVSRRVLSTLSDAFAAGAAAGAHAG